MADYAWEPSEDFLHNSNVAKFMAEHSLSSYEELKRAWLADRIWFWQAASEHLGIHWYEEPAQTVDLRRGPELPRWFPGGMTNVVASCVDRHDPDRLAYVWEGEEGAVRRLTYGNLQELVSRIAGGLVGLGVEKGDRVGIYMPMSPEALASSFACAKIGAIFVPNFSGFAAEPIVQRLEDSGARVLITADAYYRRGRKIDMQSTAHAAAAAVPSVEHVVVWPRIEEGNWDEFLDAEPVVDPLPVPSDHPFLIAYTSGTTGKPKGAVHNHTTFALKMSTETNFHIDHRDDEDNVTPPEVMYPRAEINECCSDCHDEHDVSPSKVIAQWQKRGLTETDPKKLVCTDCHFRHRLERRMIRWDKQTGKLLEVVQKLAPKTDGLKK